MTASPWTPSDTRRADGLGDLALCAECEKPVGNDVGGWTQDDRPLCQPCADSLDFRRGAGGRP